MAIQQPETPYLQIIRRTLWLLLAVTLLAGFDVSPTRGGRGETTVTVRAQDDNTTTRRKALGSMALRLSSGKAEATVSVVQSPAVAPQTVVMYLP